MRVKKSSVPTIQTCPDHIHLRHWQEWLDSAVDPDIIRLNVSSMKGQRPYSYLCYSDKLPRTNTGRLATWVLRRYTHTSSGGWWCSGLDPLNNWEPMLWGCFKPDYPIRDKEGKLIKYEHPFKTETRAFFLRVTRHIWQKVARRNNKPLPENITVTDDGEALGFWQWVLENNIPITLTEGAKKAGALLSAGYAAVALPGIDGGYRTPKDSLGNKIGNSYLVPDLKHFATIGRKVYFCFDHDHKRKTVRSVNRAISKTGQLLSKLGCDVWVITWQQPEKGVDDFLVVHGEMEFEEVANFAATLEIWSGKSYHQLTYPADVIVNCRYLGSVSIPEGEPVDKGGRGRQSFEKWGNPQQQELPVVRLESPQQGSPISLSPLSMPCNKADLIGTKADPTRGLSPKSCGTFVPDSAQLVAIKSPKGTGKTKELESVVHEALAGGQWVLVIGHRVQLLEALCHRFGIPYITEVRSSETGAVLGYGLCTDSLHPESQARFHAQNWHNGVVIIDECEQVIWHALNSKTCQRSRVAILRELKTLLCNVLQGSGRVFLADADLSDLSIDFVRSLSGYCVEPWVVVNEWQPGPDECCNIYNYTGKNPSGLVDALKKHIAGGGRPFVVCSAQKAKSKWGTRTIESLLEKEFPDLKILRIDSETIADPSHPAYGCIANLNEILQQYDIVLASPSIETGVSLDLKGHFTSVWGIFQGVQAESSARQALARLREPVDRHIWAASHGIGQIGNGSTSAKSLLASQHKLAKANIRLLLDSVLDDIDLDFQPESLKTWAKMAARVNMGMVHYRQSILEGLKAEGHRIIELGEVVNDAVKKAVTDTRDENQLAYAQAIEAEADTTDSEFDKLQEQKAKTKSERYRERKHLLMLRYGIPVDAALVLKDDDGWHAQIRLHYYLTVGREFLKMRDSKRLKEQTSKGQGAVWKPDFNRGQMSAAIACMENLGVLALLTSSGEIRGSDDVIQRMAMIAKANPWDIKIALNITISDKDTPIAIAQKLLGLLGLKLTYLRREGSDGNRQRVYGYTAPMDGRDEVFAAWMARDYVVAASAAVSFTSTPGNKDIITPPISVTRLDVEAA